MVNKCLTILLNTLIWDNHAKPEGIFCLLICIAGGMIYKQAPLRSERQEAKVITADDDEFKASIGSDVPSSLKSEGDEETDGLIDSTQNDTVNKNT